MTPPRKAMSWRDVMELHNGHPELTAGGFLRGNFRATASVPSGTHRLERNRSTGSSLDRDFQVSVNAPIWTLVGQGWAYKRCPLIRMIKSDE